MPGRQGRGRRRSGGGHGGGPLRSFQGATPYTPTRGPPRHRPATRVRSAHRALRAARSADDPRITQSELTDGPNATPTEQRANPTPITAVQRPARWPERATNAPSGMRSAALQSRTNSGHGRSILDPPRRRFIGPEFGSSSRRPAQLRAAAEDAEALLAERHAKGAEAEPAPTRRVARRPPLGLRTRPPLVRELG